MAFTKILQHILLMLLFLTVIQETYECGGRCGCFFTKATSLELHNRKVLYGFQNKNAHFNSSVHGETSGNGGNVVTWNLRRAPSGPDPLHHNGGTSKKPKTP